MGGCPTRDHLLPGGHRSRSPVASPGGGQGRLQQADAEQAAAARAADRPPAWSGCSSGRPRYRWCGGCIPGRCAAPRRAGNSSRRGEGAAGGAAEAIVKPCQRPPSLSRFPPCTRAAPTTRRSCFPSPFHSCRRCCHARPGTSATPQVRHPHSSRSG